MKRMMQLAAVSTTCALFLGACGNEQAPSAADPAGVSTTAAVGDYADPQELKAAFGRTQFDYTPAKTVAELAARATRSISGTIAGVGLSRTDGEVGNESRYTALKVTEDVTGKTVWLELPIDPDGLREVLVQGMPVAAFLGPRRIGTDLPSNDDGSIIPTGAQVWSPGIQSFALQYGRQGGIVLPFADNTNPDMVARQILTRLP